MTIHYFYPTLLWVIYYFHVFYFSKISMVLNIMSKGTHIFMISVILANLLSAQLYLIKCLQQCTSVSQMQLKGITKWQTQRHDLPVSLGDVNNTWASP